MQYALMIYDTAENRAKRLRSGTEDHYWTAWQAYMRALEEAGVLRGAARLHGADASTQVRVEGQRRVIHDGPVTTADEQLGGFILIEAGDLDKALDWAARCPAAGEAVVEVRPVDSV